MTCHCCETPITARQRSGFCAQCRKRHCNHCGKRLPEGRVQARCYECDREQREQRFTQEERPCSGCGQSLYSDWKSNWCSECRKLYRDYQLRALRARDDRRCNRCEAPLRQGQWSLQCLPCQKQRRLELANRDYRRKVGLPTRRCADCNGFIERDNTERYCRRCKKDYNAYYWEAYGREKQRERRRRANGQL